MPLYEINGKRPIIGKGTWVAPSAEVIGDVTIGAECYVGFGAIIRADFGKIRIGNQSLVEENVVIHCAKAAVIEDQAIIGHMVMIHDALVQHRALIGMNSMICDGAVVGEWSILAEQSLVKKNQTIPSNKIYAGSPAQEIGDLTERHRARLISGLQAYADLIKQYHETFKHLNERSFHS